MRLLQELNSRPHLARMHAPALSYVPGPPPAGVSSSSDLALVVKHRLEALQRLPNSQLEALLRATAQVNPQLEPLLSCVHPADTHRLSRPQVGQEVVRRVSMSDAEEALSPSPCFSQLVQDAALALSLVPAKGTVTPRSGPASPVKRRLGVKPLESAHPSGPSSSSSSFTTSGKPQHARSLRPAASAAAAVAAAAAATTRMRPNKGEPMAGSLPASKLMLKLPLDELALSGSEGLAHPRRLGAAGKHRRAVSLGSLEPLSMLDLQAGGGNELSPIPRDKRTPTFGSPSQSIGDADSVILGSESEVALTDAFSDAGSNGESVAPSCEIMADSDLVVLAPSSSETQSNASTSTSTPAKVSPKIAYLWQRGLSLAHRRGSTNPASPKTPSTGKTRFTLKRSPPKAPSPLALAPPQPTMATVVEQATAAQQLKSAPNAKGAATNPGVRLRLSSTPGLRAPRRLFLQLNNSLCEPSPDTPICRISLAAPFWLDNRTGLDLIIKDRSSTDNISMLTGFMLADEVRDRAAAPLLQLCIEDGGDDGRVLLGLLMTCIPSYFLDICQNLDVQMLDTSYHTRTSTYVCWVSTIFSNWLKLCRCVPPAAVLMPST